MVDVRNGNMSSHEGPVSFSRTSFNHEWVLSIVSRLSWGSCRKLLITSLLPRAVQSPFEIYWFVLFHFLIPQKRRWLARVVKSHLFENMPQAIRNMFLLVLAMDS